jgi:hypothetical protein
VWSALCAATSTCVVLTMRKISHLLGGVAVFAPRPMFCGLISFLILSIQMIRYFDFHFSS